jgi:hypothetical protein
MQLPQELPGPNADCWDRQLLAECRGVGSSVYTAFPGAPGEGGRR